MSKAVMVCLILFYTWIALAKSGSPPDAMVENGTHVESTTLGTHCFLESEWNWIDKAKLRLNSWTNPLKWKIFPQTQEELNCRLYELSGFPYDSNLERWDKKDKAVFQETQWLIKQKANTNARDEYSQTIFFTLSSTNASVFPVIDLFLSADADVHAQTSDLDTPFHNISRYTYNPDVLRAFITAGGDPLIENLKGETPTDIIYEREKDESHPALQEMTQILDEYGKDVE